MLALTIHLVLEGCQVGVVEHWSNAIVDDPRRPAAACYGLSAPDNVPDGGPWRPLTPVRLLRENHIVGRGLADLQQSKVVCIA